MGTRSPHDRWARSSHHAAPLVATAIATAAASFTAAGFAGTMVANVTPDAYEIVLASLTLNAGEWVAVWTRRVSARLWAPEQRH